MEDLPDELLLWVMRYLHVEDLLACRAVSKRIGRLAMDPEVWRHQHILGGDPCDCACAVLRLAPCLGGMDLYLPTSRSCLGSDTINTRCAMTKLSVQCTTIGAIGNEEIGAVLMIRNQELLGRLRCLTVGLRFGMKPAAASSLLETVASTSGLEELTISGGPGSIPKTARPVLHSQSVSSLRRFYLKWKRTFAFPYSENDKIEDFYKFVLAKHAPTLEKVHFDIYTTELTSPPASLLSSMPNLCELHCPTVPGMKALAECKSLKDLYLVVTPNFDEPDTTEFLCRANHLRKITLAFLQDSYRTSSTVGADLVWALASSGQSSVESLAVKNLPGGRLPQLHPLLRALPMLSSLRRLQVDVAPNELLLGITPDTAPALQSLVVTESNWGCIHAWLHRTKVKTLLSKNPWLHVRISNSTSSCGDKITCYACEEDCHDELLWSTKDAGFFTHDPRDKCPCPEIHKSGPWHHIADISTLKILTHAFSPYWADQIFKRNMPIRTDSESEDSSDDSLYFDSDYN